MATILKRDHQQSSSTFYRLDKREQASAASPEALALIARRCTTVFWQGYDVTMQNTTLMKGATIKGKPRKLMLSRTGDWNVRWRFDIHCGLGTLNHMRDGTMAARGFHYFDLFSFSVSLSGTGPSGLMSIVMRAITTRRNRRSIEKEMTETRKGALRLRIYAV